MFRLYQQLKNLVLEGGQDEAPVKPARERQRCAPQPEKRYFSGEITSLSGSSGMIDQQVFFDASCVLGCRRPQVGSMVHVVAERPHPLAGWQASRVEVTEQWLPDQEEERLTLVGFVSKLSQSLAIVDCATREMTFDPQCVIAAGYRPQVGDWVMIGVKIVSLGGGEQGRERGNEGRGSRGGNGEEEMVREEVEYVSPLREKETEGEVTFLCQSHGMVDDDIIFTPLVCGRGHYVRVGERVSVRCVECRHRQASWRAVAVTPVGPHPDTHSPSPHSPSLPLRPHTRASSKQPAEDASSSPGLMENKCGLVIGEECEVGKVMMGRERRIQITVRNTRSHDHLLVSVKPLPQDSQLQVAFPPHSQWCTCQLSQQGGQQPELKEAEMFRNSHTRNLKLQYNVLHANAPCRVREDVDGGGEDGGGGREDGRREKVETKCCKLEQDLDELDDPDVDVGCKSISELGNGTGNEANSTGSTSHDSGRGSVVGVVSPHIHIASGQSLEVSVVVKASTLGQISSLLLFTFAGGVRIARTVRANVVSADVDSLGPSSPYSGGHGRGGRGQGQRGRRDGPNNVVPGEKPSRPKLLRLPHRLKPYPVPEDLWECVCEGEEEEVMHIRPQLTEPLCMKNYFSRFSSLLHVEEIQREMDMRAFDLTGVPLRGCGQFLSLEVPGLVEGRPSLLMGDRVVVCMTEGGWERGDVQEGRHWEGYIHETRKDCVLLKFAQEFHQQFDNQDFDVIFQFSRTTFRRMHHAVEIAHLLGPKVLFPGQPTPKQPLIRMPPPSSCSHGNSTVSTQSQFFNPVLNPRQQAAVIRILAAQTRPTPYIVFGPPGTGKTVTLVEAILQIHRRSRESRILACAPSNSAADLLTERLHCSGLLSPGDMVRMNAIQRANPPHSISQYCMDTDSMDLAARCRVVVCTCMTAGILHSLGLPVGHFTHVIVDEAGHATETEALLPASLLAGSPHAQLVLAGDPLQLGPILSSRQAGALGLSLSLLERIMAREPYLRDPGKFVDHGSYDPLLVTKLINNYRSHSSLLRLYSDTFYHGELECCADTKMTSLLCDWEGLPHKGFPLLFHGVTGEDMREGNSPSWFNPVEIVQVVSYVQSLIDNSTYAPKLSDIGIITPYRKQVEKIRGFLARVGVEGVKVGSVEEFQGQERLVIIISTVRSTPNLVTSDLRHHIGFLSNPKRFNVAISRAQALLVVIGNPHLLCQDPHWSVLVQYAVDNGCYTGCPLPQHVASLLEDDITEGTSEDTSSLPESN